MINALEAKPRNEVESVALGYFVHFVRKEMEQFSALWDENGVQYVPFTPEGLGKVVPTSFKGRAEITAHYRMVCKNRREHVFWIDKIYSSNEPEYLIIEAHARSVIGETEAVYENSYVCIFRICGGKILELKEYANPLPVMKAFRGAYDSVTPQEHAK